MQEIRATVDTEFFRQDSQTGIGGDEVYMLNATIALYGQQKLPKKYRAAGAGGGDGQILWWMIQRNFSGGLSTATLEHRE
jgi:hypothetical protein